jgi:hypothetical protein
MAASIVENVLHERLRAAKIKTVLRLENLLKN